MGKLSFKQRKHVYKFSLVLYCELRKNWHYFQYPAIPHSSNKSNIYYFCKPHILNVRICRLQLSACLFLCCKSSSKTVYPVLWVWLVLVFLGWVYDYCLGKVLFLFIFKLNRYLLEHFIKTKKQFLHISSFLDWARIFRLVWYLFDLYFVLQFLFFLQLALCDL